MISTRPADELPDNAPLGFLNYWLYSDEVRSVKGLNDIVDGSNPGCGTQGFKARAGWDPVRPTTLASLDFCHWLIRCSIGHGSRDAKLSKAANPPKGEKIFRPYSGSGANAWSGANAVMTTCCRLDLSYVPAIQIRETNQMSSHWGHRRSIASQ